MEGWVIILRFPQSSSTKAESASLVLLAARKDGGEPRRIMIGTNAAISGGGGA